MTTKSLRVEFVITGAAMLLALFALDRAANWNLAPRIFGDALQQKASSGAGFLALGVLIASAYVAGVMCVFATFRWPTETLINRVRSDRFVELTALDRFLRDGGESPVSADALLELAFGQPDERGQPELLYQAIRHSRSVAQTYARSSSTDSLIREYEYRRSNRQVLTGLIPALGVFAVAGLIGGFRDGPLWLLGVASACGLIWVSYRAAFYQEQVAQSLLADAGFLRRWLLQASD